MSLHGQIWHSLSPYQRVWFVVTYPLLGLIVVLVVVYVGVVGKIPLEATRDLIKKANEEFARG